MIIRAVLLLVLLVGWPALQGCVPLPAGSTATRESIDVQRADASWLQFGVLLAVQWLEREDADGRLQPWMRMEVVLDDGRSRVVEQARSMAGELSVGDRVRLLRIGDFTQVTFWPYPKSADKALE